MSLENKESKRDSLHDLIKSLSKSEKSYFKKFSSIYSSGKNQNYLRLFDLMDKMETFNPKVFERKANEYAINKNLSVNKNYLYALILRAMNTLYSHEGNESHQYELIKSYRFLSTKKLNEQAGKMLHKAKNFAIKNELIPEQFVILNDERRKYTSENQNRLQQQLKLLHKEFENLLKVHYKECMIGIIYFETYELMSTDGVARNKKVLDEIAIKLDEAKSLKQIKSTETFIFNLRYYSFFESYYFLTNNFPEAAKYSVEIIKLYEAYPGKISEKLGGYISAINNSLNAQLRIPDFNNAETSIKRLEVLLDKYPQNQIYINERLLHFKILLNLNQGKYSQTNDLIQSTIKWINENETIINKSKLLILYNDLSQYYFGAGEFKKSLTINNKILNEFSEIIFNDFLTESRILHLLLHYELGDFDYLEYNLNSVYRQLPKDKTILKTERIIVQFLKKLISSNSEERTEFFRQFYDKISDLTKNPFEKFLIDELKIKYWIRSKIEKKSVQEIISKRFTDTS